MRRSPLAAAVVVALLSGSAVAEAACPDTIEFDRTGKRAVRQAEYLEIFPGDGKRRIREIGQAVTGDELASDGTWYVPQETRIEFTLAKVRYTVRSGSIFTFFCGASKPSVRLLEGTAEAAGTQSAASPVTHISTIEGSFTPYPGEVDFSVTRTWTGNPETTRSTVKVRDGASAIFAKQARTPGAKRRPCQPGRSLTLYLDGGPGR